MKKLLLFFFCILAIDAAARKPMMTIAPAVVNVDSVSFQFRHYDKYITKYRLASTWLQVNGCDTLRISHVYQYSDNGQRYEVRRNKVNAIPEYCIPGKMYQVYFEVYYPKSNRFVIYSDENDSVVFNVTGSGSQKMVMEPLNDLAQPVIHGQVAQTEVLITNNSGQYQVLDSISIPDGKWNSYDRFPIILSPGGSVRLKLHTTSVNHPSGSAYDFIAVFYHLKGGRVFDMMSCYVRATFTHGVVITSPQTKDFGLVRNGDTLRAKLHIVNQGSTVVSLAPQAAFGTYAVSKSSIAQGDTATVWLRWVVKYAEGNFLFNQPLFYDARNGKCTFTFKGTTDKKDKRPHHFVNVDSLIWIETYRQDFGEVKSSQGRLEHAFKCRNNAPVPIIITNCVTGDGGSMAWSKREPILPGEEFTITFLQDLKGGRLQFNRTVTATIQVGEITVQKQINCRGVIVYD